MNTPQCKNDVTPVEGFSRRDFVKGAMAVGVAAGGLGAFYFGYEKALGAPLRIGVVGTGDEGNVLLGALNPEFFEVRSIADIRPYNVWRAFHGDYSSETALAVRPGLMAKYGWRTEEEARRHVKVYGYQEGGYAELLKNARRDGVEAIVIALPLHLHAPAAMAAMGKGLHVLTEKLMAHSVHECKDMARMAESRDLLLAVGHQRHYNILYANAVDAIRRGVLGDLHYIRAQWNRGNLPGNDSWRQPMPRSVKKGDRLANSLDKKRKECQTQLASATGAAVELWSKRLAQVEAQIADQVVDAAEFGYVSKRITDAKGRVVYECPPIEELIRWRLWDRTGAGLMAELGSHQLDAASIFVAAMHGGEKQIPISVSAMADRPLFPPDRDIEDHVYCVLEFPTPGYNRRDPLTSFNKIDVQYSSINGNGFGGYGEIVFGTKGTLVLDREQELSILQGPASPTSVRVTAVAGPTLDTQASGAPAAVAKSVGGGAKVSRGYTEELEHWAWCIRNRAPENQPRCNAKAALGDAVIALVANMAARDGRRKAFDPRWFDVHSDMTPEGFSPSTRGDA